MTKLYILFLLFLLSFGPMCSADALQKEITDIQQQKIAIGIEQRRLLHEVRELERVLSDLSQLYDERQRQVINQQEEISQKLPLLATLGRVNPLRILIDPNTSQNTARSIILVKTLTASLKRHLQKIQAEVTEIEGLANEIEETGNSHLQILQQLEFEQAQLEQLEKMKLEELKQVDKDFLANEDDINTLLDESHSWSSKKAREVGRISKAKKLPFRRLEKPVAGKMIENPELQKKYSPNSIGLIIEAKRNAEVVAPSNGKIVFKGPFRDIGEIVILDHGRKVHTVLMGMHKINAHVGQRVYAGEKLGQMAGYGSSPPTLYLELRQKGQAIDPRPYFVEQTER